MIFLDACFGKQTPYTPVWMMRQAGRYLSEYQAVRKSAGGFLDLCKNPSLASTVSLQPVEFLDVDAAIIFSDILVVPLEMGMDLSFISGSGPVFSSPIQNSLDLKNLNPKDAVSKLSYVYKALELTRKNLDKSKALIGFCGAPWTLATYMIEGSGSKTYAKIKKLLYTNPQFAHEILQTLTDVLKGYLEEQIKAGTNAVMIFDSWASALEEDAFFEFSWAYTCQITDYIKQKYPHIAVIVFPKGISGFLERINGNFDVFGVDWSTPMSLAKKHLGERYVLQGNVEPTRLYSQNATKKAVQDLRDLMQNKRHIFNLGHGILPDIKRENAKYFVDIVRELTRV